MVATYITPPKRLEWVALALILLLAGVLRLGAPGIVEFKRDEANLSELSLNLVRGREFPLLGIDSSVGIRNAPVNVYIMALPYLFTSDPVIATQFVGLLNVIAVGLTYALARRYFGPLAAIIAGVTFAVAPWSVIYSRKIWAQDMLPVFVVLTIGSGLLGFVEGKRRMQLLHLPFLAITGQIHYVTFVLIPITVYLLVVGRKRLSRYFVLSFALVALLVLPYFIGAVQASLLNPGTLQKILSASKNSGATAAAPSGNSLEFAFFTVAGTDLHSLAGPQEFQQYLAAVPNAYPLFNALGVAILLSAIWLMVRLVWKRDARTPVDVALLLWLLVTPLIFLYPWTPAYPHYMIPIFPAAFLVLGAAVSDLWAGLGARLAIRRVVFVPVAAGIAAVAVLQVWLLVALHILVNTTATPGGFGTPLGYYMPARAAILTEHPQSVLANLDGQFIGYHDETTVWNLLLYDVPSVRFLDQDTEVYPAQPALYLSHQCTGTVQTFALRPGEPCLAITSRTSADFDKAAFKPVEAKGAFSNGAKVVAYRWEPDKGGCLMVAWTVNGPRPEDFSFAVHFLNNKGDKILDADGLSWRGRYWRAGDTVVRRFCLRSGQDRISEIAGARLGMYTFEDTAEGRKFYGVDLVDSSGGSIGQWVEIPFN